jgi:hypothetical protein
MIAGPLIWTPISKCAPYRSNDTAKSLPEMRGSYLLPGDLQSFECDNFYTRWINRATLQCFRACVLRVAADKKKTRVSAEFVGFVGLRGACQDKAFHLPRQTRD